jgi:hypothetical protein
MKKVRPTRVSAELPIEGLVSTGELEGTLHWPYVVAHSEGAGIQKSDPIQIEDMSLDWSQRIRRVFSLQPGLNESGSQASHYVVDRPAYALNCDLIWASWEASRHFYRFFSSAPTEVESSLLCSTKPLKTDVAPGQAWVLSGMVVEGVGQSFVSHEGTLQSDVFGRCASVNRPPR